MRWVNWPHVYLRAELPRQVEGSVCVDCLIRLNRLENPAWTCASSDLPCKSMKSFANKQPNFCVTAVNKSSMR